MILTEIDIKARNIVRNPQPDGQRSTTYDATVGEILMEGKSIEGDRFTLHPRGIVWVISKEKFDLPGDVTGLATLRTTWTHQGILALNLGIIDPGWNSHLATAVVNFSKSDFEITKGTPFFRVIFLTHVSTATSQPISNDNVYIERIKTNTRLFSSTFLTMDSLVIEIAEKVLGLPRWAVRLAFVAIWISIFSIILPISWTIVSQNYVMPSRVDALEALPAQVDALQKEVAVLQHRNSSPPDVSKNH